MYPKPINELAIQPFNQLMPKSRQQKQSTITTLESGLKEAKAVVFANFQGLTVAKAEDLRRKARAEGVKVLVAKKTLVKKALHDLGETTIEPKSFPGGVATFMAMTDEVSAAKVVHTFAKENEIVTIYGGILEGKFIDASGVKNLASLPSKHQLLGQLVGTLNAPVSGFVNVLAGNIRNLVSVLNNIKEKQA